MLSVNEYLRNHWVHNIQYSCIRETLNKTLVSMGYNVLSEFITEFKDASDKFPEYFV